MIIFSYIYLLRFVSFLMLPSFLEICFSLYKYYFPLMQFLPKILPSSTFNLLLMATSSQTTVIPPAQADPNKITIEKYRCECDIPSDCTLEVLGPQYEDWKTNPLILALRFIIMSELHLQNLRLLLPPLFHYIFAIHDIHPLQISTNSIRTMSGFVLSNLNLGLGLAEFHLCHVRVRSGKSLKYYFILYGNWKSPSVN